MPESTTFSWKVITTLYSCVGSPLLALRTFVQFIHHGHTEKYIYSVAIKACSDRSLVRLGKCIHGRMVSDGCAESNPALKNCLLEMYMNCREKSVAVKLFSSMSRDSVSWNTMIRGFFKNGDPETALKLFNSMMNDGVFPDAASIVSIMPVCVCLKALKFGKWVHALVEKVNKFGENLRVSNSIIDMYSKCKRMNSSRKIFDRMRERDVITWTTIINGYVLNKEVRIALSLSSRMQIDGKVRPNSVTMALLLSGCATLGAIENGKCLHGWAIRQRLDSDIIVETALVSFYAKCIHFDQCLRVFKHTSKTKIAQWTALISGCVHNGRAKEAIEFFKQTQVHQINPTITTLKSLLPAYAILANLQPTANLHSYITQIGFLSNLEVSTSLVDIYSKCGCLKSAHKLFDSVSINQKDIFLWSAIIYGYGMHGDGEIAVSLFNDMVRNGVRPNEITYTAVLHACGHAGLVEEGVDLFHSMVRDPSVSLDIVHYTCVVDLLGRAGRIKEAYDMIRSMPCERDGAVWGALLGACMTHGDVEMGEVAAKCLFDIDKECLENYVLLAKIYEGAGMWKKGESVREMMGRIGPRKAAGQSSVAVRNRGTQIC